MFLRSSVNRGDSVTFRDIKGVNWQFPKRGVIGGLRIGFPVDSGDLTEKEQAWMENLRYVSSFKFKSW